MSPLAPVLLLVACIGLPARGDTLENDRPIENGRSLEELSAIIADHTVTHIGHEFYRLFSQARQLKYPSSQANLVVKERPSARWGNLIWIEYGTTRVFESIWVPGRGQLDGLADQAAEATEQQLLRIKLQLLLLDDSDLDRDEL